MASCFAAWLLRWRRFHIKGCRSRNGRRHSRETANRAQGFLEGWPPEPGRHRPALLVGILAGRARGQSPYPVGSAHPHPPARGGRGDDLPRALHEPGRLRKSLPLPEPGPRRSRAAMAMGSTWPSLLHVRRLPVHRSMPERSAHLQGSYVAVDRNRGDTHRPLPGPSRTGLHGLQRCLPASRGDRRGRRSPGGRSAALHGLCPLRGPLSSPGGAGRAAPVTGIRGPSRWKLPSPAAPAVT